MQKQVFIILMFCLLIDTKSFPETNPPKRELRGVWIATVVNLDWPSSPFLSPDRQRSELVSTLDQLRAIGINAIFFQVRPECDAFYQSTYEPWSYFLTGKQGKAPSPFYDPLEFAVSEAHKRGMELHAWFNPYRAIREIGSFQIDSTHVTVRHPDWAIQIGNFKFLNPGLPMVREHVTAVIIDVARRYDVDGIHFDDYFYPYPPSNITHEDDQTFANYSRGFADRGDWRRDNVNLLIEMVYDSIKAIKPYVKFGVSPFGIWKDGVPAGIAGLNAYGSIYADAVTWFNRQIVDYVAPQLYWAFGGGQDYGKLLPWWAAQTNQRHLYAGHAVYKIGGWNAAEVLKQIRLNRETSGVYGNIFFRATHVKYNLQGFTDSLKNDFYRYPAISPVMAWKETLPPNRPENFRYEPVVASGFPTLRWEKSAVAADGDSANRYVIYRFEKGVVQSNDLEDPSHILAISGELNYSPPMPPNIGNSYYYAVTALDRNANESEMSHVLTVSSPLPPMLASPANGDTNQPQEVFFAWHRGSDAVSYHLQIAHDSTFASPLLFDKSGISDTFKIVTGFRAQQEYYWRVRAGNAGGAGEFSENRNFTTGFPMAPMLAYPTDNIADIPINPIFTWYLVKDAISYHLQLAKSYNFQSTSMVVDSSGIADTTFSKVKLDYNNYYFWRVSASNLVGAGEWSKAFKFKTVQFTDVPEPELPIAYRLYQNYPNPFNIATAIAFDLPEPAPVTLKIFDALGREIVSILDRTLDRGHHHVIFGAGELTSGIYLCRLKAGAYVLTGKMLVLK